MSLLAPRPSYPSVKFPELGSEVDGIVTRPPEDRQARDFDTGKPAFWDEDKTQPKMETRIILDVGGTEHALYASGRLAYAISDAIREAGASDLEVGARLWVKHHDLGERKGKGKAPKLFKAKVSPPKPRDDDEPDF
jgi:hypothetical protein